MPRGERLPREEELADADGQPAADHASRRPKWVLAAILLLCFGVVAAIGTASWLVYREMTRSPESLTPASTASDAELDASDERYIRVGWKTDAREVLAKFIAARTVEEKARYVLNAERIRPRMDAFYGGVEINDGDTPAEAFSEFDLSEEDRRRGMFLMIYDQPPQFDIRRFFRPLAPTEVQYGLEEPGILLSELGRARNFSIEPVRCHAFFKRTDDGLKLDWEMFAQTKYRTFQNFVELPEPGLTGVFRVFVVEDVPERGQAVTGTRTYRLADPANQDDSARINVPVDSEVGRAVSIINWRGSEEKTPVVRNATVELKWGGEPEHPVLEISRFICWEFLGLGGRPAPGTYEGY